MRLYKIFTLSFYLTVITFNYGFSYSSFGKERINLTIQSERHHVIVASFKNQSQAQKELMRLNNLGYRRAKILYDENGKNFRISIMSFDKRSSAINYTKELNQSGFNDIWVFHNSSNQSSPNPIVKARVNPSINLPPNLKQLPSKPQIKSNSPSKDPLPRYKTLGARDQDYHIFVG